jgi:hypothetical protein
VNAIVGKENEMIFLKNTETGHYVKSITGEAVEYTDSRLDAFDFDKEPTEKEKELFHSWILGAGEKAPVEFVRE